MYNSNYKEKGFEILLWHCQPLCDIIYSTSG